MTNSQILEQNNALDNNIVTENNAVLNSQSLAQTETEASKATKTQTKTWTGRVSLDDRQYQNKPQKDDVGRINNAIANGATEIDEDELIEAITSGQSWNPTTFNGKRDREHFIEMSALVADFDDGFQSLDEIITRAEEHGLKFSFIHESFSHTPKRPKYRGVILLEQPIKDFQTAKFYCEYIKDVFKGMVDKGAAEACRLYYGGREGSLVFQNKGQILSLSSLEQSAATFKKTLEEQKTRRQTPAKQQPSPKFENTKTDTEKIGSDNIDETNGIYSVGFDEIGLLIVNDVENHTFIEFDANDYEGVLSSIENLARLLEIKTALEVLDTEICEDYDSWLQIGMALHHEGATNGNGDFSDAMRELFHAWSRTSDKYEEEETENKWSSFGDRDGSIKINTLFHYAHEKVTNVEKLTQEIYPLVDNYYTALQLDPKPTIKETSSDIRNLSTANSPISFVGKAYIDKGIHFDTSDSKETIVRIYNPEEGIWEKQNLKSFYADAEYRLNACMKNSYGTIKPLNVKQQKELYAYINVYTKSDPNYIGYKWQSEQSGNIIAFRNKILNLKTKQEEEFRKELYLENKLEREYRPEDGTDCPNWLKLISDLTGNDEKVMDVLEAAALLTLTGRGDTERSFITLYSEDGGAGKGTFMRTLQSLAGKDRSKTASFDRLSDGNLMTSFENKTLIVFPEERNKLYPNSNAYASLLKLTSKDRIDARGNYQAGIEFQSNAMLFVATNTFLFGNDGGMNRRILQVVCPKKENLIPDRNFGKKLEKELSQITNRLLNKFDFDADNARDLLEEASDYEAFSNNARIMANELSNVSQFLEEMVVAVCPINRDRGLKANEYKTNENEYKKNPAPFVNITTLYDAFKIYSANVNPGSKIMKKTNFIKEVKAHYKLNLGADFILEELKELRVQGVTGRAARFLGLIPSEEAKNNDLFRPLQHK
ncbi:MAG: PriCT-2 domain-containing protein [Cyanobacteria bacterium P01_A01_bin.83]